MIGSIILTTALAMSLTAMVMYFLSYRGYGNTLKYGRIAYHLMAMLVIMASAYLFYILLTHQYAFKYVYSYSSNELPKGILAATFWAGQEGSFMLWLLFTSVVGIFLQSYTSKRGDLEQRVMTVYALSTTFLLVMVSPMFKNPFAYIWAEPLFIPSGEISSTFYNLPFLQSFMFSDNSTGQNFIKMNQELYAALKNAGISVNQFVADGKGLNPQLLNFWMQIHPPILFLGFAMATVPFAFAMAAMMKNDYKDWIRQSFPWLLAGMGVLGLGIMLGGYWAYEMLGWGGYWAWDPVENSSLIPWLVGVACIHTMLVQKKSQGKGGIGKFAKTNLILCLMTYILVLYSTFLTRSGVLGDASVHSFVDPGMGVYLFLLIFISSFIVSGFGMLIYRWKYLTEHSPIEESLLSRELALFTAAVALSASAIIVLVGTSAPLFGHSVDTFFYNEMHLPIAIIIGFLNGISLLMKWKSNTPKEVLNKSLMAAGISAVFTVMVAVFGKVSDVMMLLLTFSTAFTLVVNADIAIKIIRGNLKKIGAYVAHIGIALFILGVIGSAAYSDHVDLDLIKNEPKEAFGYTMTFTGLEPIENNTKYAFNISLQKGDKNYTVSPVMYISDFNNGLVREPAILTMFTRDFYVSPMGYEEGGAQAEHNHGQQVVLDKDVPVDFQGAKVTFTKFDFPESTMQDMMAGKDFEIGATVNVQKDGKSNDVELAMKNKGGQRELTSASLEEANLKFTLLNLDAAGKIQVDISPLKDPHAEEQASAPGKEVLTISASVKPFINLVWTGVLVMVLGFGVSVVRRLKDSAA